jgi:phage replication O-like protein O
MNKNQIEAPNYTQIPNVIFDYWMTRLTPAEFKVLLCICRKIFGWHKYKDLISLRQIEQMTGLAKSSIVKNIETLIELGLINKIKSKDEFDGSDAPNQYEINVIEKPEISQENIGGSTLSGHPPVLSVDTPRVHSVDTQKKDLTKENIQNNTRGGKSFSSSKNKVDPPEKIEVCPEVRLTEKEVESLKKEFGNSGALEMLKILSNYKLSSGKTYKSDYHAVIGWVKDRYLEKKTPTSKGKLALPGDGIIDGPDAAWRKKKL